MATAESYPAMSDAAAPAVEGKPLRVVTVIRTSPKQSFGIALAGKNTVCGVRSESLGKAAGLKRDNVLLKVDDERRLAPTGEYCDALGELLGPLAPDARERIRALSSSCFGGVGGARDFALIAIVACLNARGL